MKPAEIEAVAVTTENAAKDLFAALAAVMKLRRGCADPNCDCETCRLAAEIRDPKSQLRAQTRYAWLTGVWSVTSDKALSGEIRRGDDANHER